VLGRIASLAQRDVMFLLIRVGRVAAQIRVITRRVYGVAVVLTVAATLVARPPCGFISGSGAVSDSAGAAAGIGVRSAELGKPLKLPEVLGRMGL